MDKVKDINDAGIFISGLLKINNTYSKKTLTEKLVSEGYSIETASYAVENTDIDWDLMAVKSALALVTFNHTERYTYSEVMEYLQNEEFTADQSRIGAWSVRARLRAVEDREKSNGIIFLIFGVVFVVMFVAAFI